MGLDRRILQINDDGEIIEIFNNKEEIVKIFKKYIQGLDTALRNPKRRYCGFFWMWKFRYDLGERPILETSKRYLEVYVYKPDEDIKDEYGLYPKELNPYILEHLVFVKRFSHTKKIEKELLISTSSIYDVLNGTKVFHRGYYFSHTPLREEDRLVSDILDIKERYIENELLPGDLEKYEELKEELKEYNIEKYNFELEE